VDVRSVAWDLCRSVDTVNTADTRTVVVSTRLFRVPWGHRKNGGLSASIAHRVEKKLENPGQTLEDTSPLRSPPNNRQPAGVLPMDAGRYLPQLQRGIVQIGRNRMRSSNTPDSLGTDTEIEQRAQ